MAVTGWGSAGDVAPVSEECTHDALFGGRVVLQQPARGHGYRVNADALLLAVFACGRGPASVAFDLGAGVGSVGLSLLHLRASRRVVMIESDPNAARLAERNLRANGWKDDGEVVLGDVAEVARDRRAEAQLIVCNPPYVEPGRGRLALDVVRARARSGRLATFVTAARSVAGRRARVCFVYPAAELATLLITLRASGLEPKRLRAVHAARGVPARVVLVEAQPAKAGGLVVLPPLFERD